jgi:dolichol-phosphate mannosyltransferase
MDCDFSHDPASIPDFLQKLKNHDLAIGSRYIGGIRIMNWPMQRLLLSYFASIYARIITGIPFTDSTGGFNCYSKKALRSLNLDNVFSIGYAFQIELKYKLWSKGLPCVEVPITFWERTVGKSKMSRKIVFEAVINVVRLRIKKLTGTLQ